MDSETKIWFESLYYMTVMAAMTLGGIYFLMKQAGIRTRQDLTDVEKIVQFILMLMNSILALIAGLIGTMGSLMVVLFCDAGPVPACMAVALGVLFVCSIVVALSVYAIMAMVRKDNRAVWYLHFYPVPLLAFAIAMYWLIPDGIIVWAGMIGIGLLATIYALAIRKPRQPVVVGKSPENPFQGSMLIDQ